MKATAEKSNPSNDSKASSSRAACGLGSEAGFADRRDSTLSYTELESAIHEGPLGVAQRKQLEGTFGVTAQRQGAGGPRNLPGADIHVAPRQRGQERHLPREAWHVIQQKQGWNRPTVQKFRPQTEPVSPQHQSPWPVIQRQVIKSAGLELELKGAGICKIEGGQEKEYGLHEKVIDRDDWWIEIDSHMPELVTKPTEQQDELFSWLRLGHEVLIELQLLAEKAALLESLGEEDDIIRLQQEMWQTINRIGLPLDADVGLSPKNENNKYLAKPQISFGIRKGQLSNFAQSLGRPQGIKYSEGYNKAGEKFENEEWPRVNQEVGKIYNSSPIWFNEKGQAFSRKLVSASNEAQGLSLMTILTILFATRKQDYDDESQYYKARFSVMPRVPLSDLYDALEEEKQKEYRELMQSWLEAIELHHQNTKETSEHYPTTIENATQNQSIEIEQELESIIDPTKRGHKTLKDKQKQVDAISSDDLATTGNVGASVGAFDLPEASDGIYEIRSMPYIRIEDYAKVEKIYEETIDAYGGMA